MATSCRDMFIKDERDIDGRAVVHTADAVYCVIRRVRPTNSKYSSLRERDIERYAFVICSLWERDMSATQTLNHIKAPS